jgi:hypothetical protein
MCPFCISAVVSVAAGTVTTAGVASLFAFARRIPDRALPPALPRLGTEARDRLESLHDPRDDRDGR